MLNILGKNISATLQATVPSSFLISNVQSSTDMCRQPLPLQATPALWKRSFRTSPPSITWRVPPCVAVLAGVPGHGGSSTVHWSTIHRPVDGMILCVILGHLVWHKLDWPDIKQVKYWSEELSKNSYDGIIGLSQGSAMTALLLSMASVPHFFDILWACLEGNFYILAQPSWKSPRLPPSKDSAHQICYPLLRYALISL